MCESAIGASVKVASSSISKWVSIKAATSVGAVGGTRQLDPHIAQLPPGYLQTIQKTLDFILDDGVGDGVLGDFRLVALQQVGSADRIPPETPMPCSENGMRKPSFALVETAAHQIFEMFERLLGLGPLAHNSNWAPRAAASIMTPMMLLPLTSRPSRSSRISASNPAARVTNLAAARACKPQSVDDDNFPLQHLDAPLFPADPIAHWATPSILVLDDGP